jgi:hypothetical protein
LKKYEQPAKHEQNSLEYLHWVPDAVRSLRLWTYRQDRAFRKSYDSHCRAAEEYLFDPGVSMGCNNDEVRTPIPCLRKDFLMWFPCSYRRSRLNSSSNLAFDKSLQFGEAPIPQLILHLRQNNLTETEVGRIYRRFNDIHQVQSGTELLGQRKGISQGVL